MSIRINGFYEFGEFRFDPERRVLWHGDGAVPLPPKATEVLSVLIKDHGNLVEREELIQAVWQDTFVEEGNLNHAVSALRKALGQDGIIQTVPRRGYRFTADVKEVPNGIQQGLVIEKRTLSHTTIEEQEEIFDESQITTVSDRSRLAQARLRNYFALATGTLILISFIGAAAFFGLFPRSAKPVRTSIQSIAVLPLKSFSRNNSDEELRFRITDALITRLGSFDKIVVRPTSSVLRFAAEDRDIKQAGQQLGVDAILEGRVQAEGDRLRVTLQLISVASDDQLWSEQFDGRVGEILALQDAISNRLRKDFAFVENEDFVRHAPANNESFEAYLKGRFVWNQRRRESYFKALEYFQKSVEADPNFALGYTGISDCYHLLQQRNVLSTIDAFTKAEAAARKALELDPNLAEAHISMGSVSFIRYSRWAEAENYYRRAIELSPNLAEAYARMGMLLNAWARFDEAHTVLKKAEELDPTSVNNAIYLGANYYFSKQLDRAEAQFKRILEFAPETERAHFFLERIYAIQGRHDEAVDHALKERSVFRPESIEPLRAAYRNSGIRGFWLKQIDFLKEESKEMRGLENHIASRYALLGDSELACDYVEKNLENLGSMHNYGRVDPLFDLLRPNPRFVALMRNASPAV